jgi:hypothetical protein
VVGEDGAELERESIERSTELLFVEQERCCSASLLPGWCFHCARAQVVGRQTLNHYKQRRGCTVTFRWRVRDDGLQAPTKQLVQIVIDYANGVGDGTHETIVRSFPPVQYEANALA